MIRTTAIPEVESPAEVINNTFGKAAEVLQTLNKSMGDTVGLYDFLQIFWNEVSADKFKPNWHVEQLCKELETLAERVGDNKPKSHDLIINIPPGTTKTIICSIMFPAWCWTRWYWMRFITASYSATLSLESAEKSRDLIRSEKFRELYPELAIKDDKDTKSNFRVTKQTLVHVGRAPRTQLGGNRYSTSVGGTLTGFHAHILIVDDPLNPEQAASEKELENCNHWMEQTLPTRKTDKEVSASVLVMQRLHQDDPTGRLLEKKGKKIRHICLPGQIRDYKEFVQPPELAAFYINNLLDPVRLHWEILEEMEADLGQYGFAGQVGQNPAPPGGGMFKVDFLSIVDKMPSNVKVIRTVRYWDKAGTQGGGAYTVGVKMSSLTNGHFVVTDVKRGQWGTEKREDIILSTAGSDGVDVRVFIEQEPGSGGKESAESTVRNLAGYIIKADRPTGDKIFRADPFSVQVNNGNVMLMRADWNKAFIDELRMFPFGTYKDQVDGGSGAFSMLTGKKEVRIIR